MKQLRKWLLLTLSAFSFLGALVCAGIWNARRELPFNDDGRYFDAASATVVHEQSLIVYAALAFGLAALGISALWFAKRR